MTSQLNVDTIVDKAGSGGTNVKVGNTSTYVADGGSATQNLVQGLCKAWAAYGSSGTTFQNSFNFSSATDNTNGDYTFTYTNAFSNNDAPSTVGFQSHTSGTQASIPSWESRNSTTIRVNCFDDVKNENGITDAAATVHTMGDLA
jgi:hypothetical protein